MSHDKLRLGSPVFQEFPFHKCASVSMFCNSITNLTFSVFWHCSWIQAHSPYRSILICVCRLMRKDKTTLTRYLWMVNGLPSMMNSATTHQTQQKAMLLLYNMPAVTWSSRETPQTCNHSHSISYTIPPLLPDIPPIHHSNHMPHHHNGYHLLCLLTMNLIKKYLITTSGHPGTCSTQHQMLVTNTVSNHRTVFSVTNMTKEGKMHVKGEPKLPNVLVGGFRSFGTRHCVIVWLVPSSSGSSHTPLDPEDEGNTILPNTTNHSPNTTLSHLQYHCCKNLKSHMFWGNL